MPIFVDYSQVFIANIMQQPGVHVTGEVEEDLIRHMVLNSLRSYRVKYSEKYGELIICCDSKNNWRREIYPQYKAGRKKGRETSHLNWSSIYTAIDKIKNEISDNFPYKVIAAEQSEADDIIAVLCEYYEGKEKILILSGDKDFVQLQKYSGVDQWSPVQKKFVTTDDPLMYKKEHILKGDRGDGVPNFLSPDNTFVDGLRQKPLQRKKVDSWLGLKPELFCDHQMLAGYHRNKSMVDLDCIPERIKERIMENYLILEDIGRSKLFNYFIQYKLKNLMEKIQEF